VKRRAFLATAGLAAIASRAFALGRTPVGGTLRFHVPYSLGAIDPHDLGDPAAALFAHAVFDPLFGLDSSGAPYPALATALPTREAGDTIVRVREGLKTARGAVIDGHDVIFSIERARGRGGAALLGDIPRPAPRKGDILAVSFGAVDPTRLAKALASPLLAIVKRSFDAAVPDGTGAFHADVTPAKLTLTRNVNAARGASFLDGIEVSSAKDLTTSLREFEGEHDDLGWLGMGLHGGRKNAMKLDLGRAAWLVLVTGSDAGPFGAPGAAQRLVDAFPPERLAHLGLGPLPAANGDPAWGGPPCDLLVDETAAHSIEAARAIAAVISRPSHEVTVATVPRAEIGRRRARNKATLAIEIARPLGPSSLHALMSLAAVEDVSRARELDRHPPKLSANAPARSLTSTLRVGVIGDVRVAGGVMPDWVLARGSGGESWDLGASWKRVAKK
jgi:peptide/nickel transport system substrate-binding protein